MSTTYRTVVSLSATGTANLAADAHTKSGSCSGDSDIMAETQLIGTSSEAITTGEIANGDCLFLEFTNLSDTNFVSFSFESPAVAGTKSFKLLPGQSMILARPSGAIYAIADTAAVTILKRAVEA